ncbi:MAG: OmpA family protein [Bacteroidales bacterium]|nr:OmpA family protein [Bacteroidales bacterium]
MKKTSLLSFTGIYVLLFFSCVPARQFQELQENYQKCVEQTDILKSENENLNIQSTELASQIGVLKDEVARLLTDSIIKAEQLKEFQNNLDKVDRQYRDLQVAQEELLKGNAVETKQLLKQLQLIQEDLQIREDQVRLMQAKVDADKKELLNVQKELEERNKKMVELEAVLHSKDSVMNALKEKISKALLGFENNGLTVSRKEGKIYVSMEEKLLFASGSAEIDPNGVDAIKKLAKVLEENPDINIMIEGHTDDVKYIPDAAIQDNWDLSVKRANTVVRILLKNSKIDPKRLTSAGRGEYIPLETGKTPEARKKNRRTEIILTPNLNELFEIAESSK